MSIAQVFIEALESLNSNKLRSGLTILGIVIGVAAVIAMLSVGQGAQSSITNSINGIGTNVLFVFSGGRPSRDGPPQTSNRRLTMEDAEALIDPIAAPSVAAVSAVIQASATASAEGQSSSTSVNGVTANYDEIRNETVAEGQFISEEHVTGHSTVAVIGPELADALFGTHTDIVGKKIRLDDKPFRIIGVLASKGGSSMGSSDNQIIIPLTTARDRIANRGGSNVDTIYVQSTSAEATTSAQDEITAILRARHRTVEGEDDFSVFSQQDMLATASSVTGILTVFLGGIAAISLLVGGIGIMNIMLVSVAERTREIGLRKALGARKRDILTQFLTESLLLSLLGGLIGVAFGWGIAQIVGQVAASTGNSFTPDVRLSSVLLATLFSAGIGLFFGIYPANRAASLEPVEALRYE